MKKARILFLASVATLAFGLGANAQEVNAEGAKSMLKSLTGLMPQKVIDTGFITVDPQGQAYKVKVDFGKLAAGLAPHDMDFSLTGLFDMMVSPAGADGLYTVKRDASELALTGKWNKGEAKGDFNYVLKDFTLDGQWDPAIPYFRSAVSHSTGGTMTIKDELQDIDASFGPMDQTISGTVNADGSADILGKATMDGIRETVRTKDQPAFVMRFGKLDMDAAIKGTRTREIGAIVDFLVAHNGEGPMKPEDQKALLDIVNKAMPVFSSLDETVLARDVSFTAQDVEVAFADASYNFGMKGLADNSDIHLGLAFNKPVIKGIPQAEPFADLVPQTMSLKVSVPGLNFTSALDYFLKNGDFSKKDPLNKEQGDEMGRVFLGGNGKMDLAVPEFTATSPLYNISVTGHMATDVQAVPVTATAEFDITAKDLDKTIKGIQDLAVKVPDLNTASFGLMMAKGMAKTDADGTAHWKIEVDENSVVKINGQVMPH